MASFNKWIVMGNLTRDPEVAFSKAGTAYCRFSVAVTESRKTKDGKWEDDTSFFDGTAFGKTAELFGNYTKGEQVLLEGKAKQETWEDKSSGGKRSAVRMIVDRIARVSKPGTNGSTTKPSAVASPAQADDDIPW